jgi:hypothetical protein
MEGNTCEFVVGRLLEIRFAPGPTHVVDIPGMIDLAVRSLSAHDVQTRFTVVADWRAVPIMSPETAARMRQFLSGINHRVTRSAILTQPANATTNMQIVRIVHESDNANRRHFGSPHMLHRWLSEILNDAESRRLKEFLGSSAP